MNIVVIGLGSMGKRRIRLIKKIYPQMRIIGVDQNTERVIVAEKEFGIIGYAQLEQALEKELIDCAFVSTSPLSHNEIIKVCLTNHIHVFTELNLIDDGYEENMALAKKNERILFLSSTFLYRDEIKYIKEKIEAQKDRKINYSYHVGQYLPDWHPWEDYKNFFVGKKKTNACREIFAIEFPWITSVFGDISSIQILKGKGTELQVEYNDNYLLLIEHKTGNKGMVAVDVMSRKAVRNLEIFGEAVYLTWNGLPDGLKEYDIAKKNEKNILLYDKAEHVDGYGAYIIENAYQNEIEAFFKVIQKEIKPIYDFEKDREILHWIDLIEG